MFFFYLQLLWALIRQTSKSFITIACHLKKICVGLEPSLLKWIHISWTKTVKIFRTRTYVYYVKCGGTLVRIAIRQMKGLSEYKLIFNTQRWDSFKRLIDKHLYNERSWDSYKRLDEFLVRFFFRQFFPYFSIFQLFFWFTFKLILLSFILFLA